MADIIKLLVIIFLVYWLFRAAVFVTKRSIMLIKLNSLKKLCNANITLHSFPYSPFQKRSTNPDVTVEIFNTVYAIRLYSGISSTRFVHFADERFSVVYKRLRAMVMPSHGAVRPPKGVRLTYSAGGHVNVMRDMELDAGGREVVRVLLFSPAPHEVSYVTEERSTIRLAFTGDTLYGYRVFTPTTLVTFIDRESRRMEAERKNPSFN